MRSTQPAEASPALPSDIVAPLRRIKQVRNRQVTSAFLSVLNGLRGHGVVHEIRIRFALPNQSPQNIRVDQAVPLGQCAEINHADFLDKVFMEIKDNFRKIEIAVEAVLPNGKKFCRNFS